MTAPVINGQPTDRKFQRPIGGAFVHAVKQLRDAIEPVAISILPSSVVEAANLPQVNPSKGWAFASGLNATLGLALGALSWDSSQGTVSNSVYVNLALAIASGLAAHEDLQKDRATATERSLGQRALNQARQHVFDQSWNYPSDQGQTIVARYLEAVRIGNDLHAAAAMAPLERPTVHDLYAMSERVQAELGIDSRGFMKSEQAPPGFMPAAQGMQRGQSLQQSLS